MTEWVNRTFGDQEIRQVLGYNADERGRMERAEGFATDDRSFEFPLATWGWGRSQVEAYVQQVVGEPWRKSCCTFCPFAAGKPDVLARYREAPEEAAEALFLEHVALAFNPRMTLYAGRSLRSVLERDSNAPALRRFHELLDDCPWALYRVRRIVWAKGRADRKTERLHESTRQGVTTELLRRGGQVEEDHVRLWVVRREDGFPSREEMLVAAPAVVDDKCRTRFEANWARLTRTGFWE